jgi:O-antigen ligase
MAVALCAAMVLLLVTPRMRMVLLLGGTAAAVLGVWLFIRFLPQFKEIDFLYRYVRTIENLVNGYDFTSGRTGLFALAIEGFRSAPVFGIGFDQFHTLVNPLLTDIEGNVMQDAHNIYLQMLCETGIVGTVLTLAPMAWILVTTFRSLLRARKQPGRPGVQPLTVSLLLQSYLLLLGVLDPTFQKLIFWCFYGISAMLLIVGMERCGFRKGGRR